MSEYTGKAGTIYIELASKRGPVDGYEVWFEEFCILGVGPTEIDALRDAWRYTGDILLLISEATIKASENVIAASSGGD